MTAATAILPLSRGALEQAAAEAWAEARRRVASPVIRSQKYVFRGNNLAFQRSLAHERMLSGPAETGKTLAALHELNRLAWANPGMQAAIVRKTYQSMPGSVLQTYQQRILPHPPGDSRCPIRAYGGEMRPERYIYPNGSVIWLGGMDNPDRVLSSERDIIYVNQAEELSLAEWETLATRVTGRAGNVEHPQLIGDCNPGGRQHWIKLRARDGSLEMHESRHRDNPLLYDEKGRLTGQGRVTLAILEGLSGVRKERLYHGRWATAEGVIYADYDPDVHLIDRFDIPADWLRFRVIDFGLVNPMVCQWWAVDGDGRMYRYREIYMTGRTVTAHSADILKHSQNERITATICDHDAEDRATLAENGIPNRPARKAVSVGIDRVQDRLKVQADGRPRLFFLRDSVVETDQSLIAGRKPVSTEDEFDGYIWSNSRTREMPVKENDHGMDATRYAVMWVDGGGNYLDWLKRQVGE